jgi:hypothetical protein
LVPEWWGKTPFHEWDPIWFLSTYNVELRSIAAEIIGYEKILANFDSIILDFDEKEDMELWLLLESDSNEIKILKVRCPSAKKYYYLRVPPSMYDVNSARMWSFGFDDAAGIDIVKET